MCKRIIMRTDSETIAFLIDDNKLLVEQNRKLKELREVNEQLLNIGRRENERLREQLKELQK
jgi:hypothetical protein